MPQQQGFSGSITPQATLSLGENQGFEHVRPRLLVRGKQFQQVRHRNHALVALLVVKNNEMIDTILLHKAEAIFQRRIGRGRNELTRHDLGNSHPGGTFIFRRDFV